jgi:hypothetical protein
VPDTVVRVTWPSGTTSAVQAWLLPADVAGSWEVVVSNPADERRVRMRFTQQYQRVSGTASEDGRTMSLNAARLAGDSIEFQLAGKGGDKQEILRFAGRVAGALMEGTIRSSSDTTARRWRAARP